MDLEEKIVERFLQVFLSMESCLRLGEGSVNGI